MTRYCSDNRNAYKGVVAILESDDAILLRYASGMLSEWLQTNLDAAGQSQAWLARELTERLGRSIDRAAVNKMIKGSRKISADELVEISKLLDATPPMRSDETSPEGLRMVTVAAFVQAGHWAETWEWEEDSWYQVAVPRDPGLEGFRLYAAETRGPSMNKRWHEGTIVVFTNVAETQESPVSGKRYIVERKRAGGEAEYTVKLLTKDNDGEFWLMPESDDPRFQAPISVRDGTNDGDTVTILGRVRFAVSRE